MFVDDNSEELSRAEYIKLNLHLHSRMKERTNGKLRALKNIVYLYSQPLGETTSYSGRIDSKSGRNDSGEQDIGRNDLLPSSRVESSRVADFSYPISYILDVF